MDAVAAVIGDIVHSRQHADRAVAQGRLEQILSETNAITRHLEPFRPTFSDEFQGLFASVADAVHATFVMRLQLTGGLDCRFGIGFGENAPVASSVATLQDGSAWWSAREAIVETKAKEARTRALRTWYVPHAENGPDADLLNAYLLSRDQLLSGFDDRSKRIAFRTMSGMTQNEIAELEGVTQPAVSQSMARNGIHALLAGAELARGRS